jgi:hypothetical protein
MVAGLWKFLVDPQRFRATTGHRTENPTSWEGALLGFYETRVRRAAGVSGQ